MTVAKLREWLKDKPDSMRVFINDYEMGGMIEASPMLMSETFITRIWENDRYVSRSHVEEVVVL